jgi:excisionase family DNA binding protein
MKGQPRIGQPASVRGLIVEKVIYSMALDPFMSLRAVADYCDVSLRTVHSWIMERTPERALPVYRVLGGKLLVRRSEIDAWMARWRCQGRPAVVAAAREFGVVPLP